MFLKGYPLEACLLTKQNFLNMYFYAGLKHMATQQCGNGSYVDWLRWSCDISPCDLSPERNLETYGRPVKSAMAAIAQL